jgi:hypothetical protein
VLNDGAWSPSSQRQRCNQASTGAQQNVARYRQELENGVNEERRHILFRLLIEEEDKLGRTAEQRDEMDRQIGVERARSGRKSSNMLNARSKPGTRGRKRTCR